MKRSLSKNAHGVTVPATGTAAEVPGLVTKRVVAQAASVSPRCVDNWIAEKKIPAIKISARCIRFSLALSCARWSDSRSKRQLDEIVAKKSARRAGEQDRA